MVRIIPKIIVVIALIFSPFNLWADGIIVDYATGRFKDGFYQVDANIDYELSNSVVEALNHGIQLRFDITIEVKRVRRWRWDQNVSTAILSFTLDHLPISNNYQVTNIVTGERKQFNDLDESLTFLGSIKEFPVIAEEDLLDDQSYNCFLMSELRIRNLPLPLQPLALISPSWELDSPWYEWSIR